MSKIKVTVWNEFYHEQHSETVKKVYPEGMHQVIATALNKCPTIEAQGVHLYEEEQGLPDEILNNTDVLIWWGHMKHGDVKDELVEKVYNRVLAGMGLIVLHSGHHSKIFRRLMGSSGNLKWREIGEKARHWVIMPEHPITQGIGPFIEIEHAEMYGEVFDIPAPDELLFIAWFQGGEVFRSGCCYHRGNGKIFYFQPGHETYPIYRQAEIQQVITNAVHWAVPASNLKPRTCDHCKPLEDIKEE